MRSGHPRIEHYLEPIESGDLETQVALVPRDNGERRYIELLVDDSQMLRKELTIDDLEELADEAKKMIEWVKRGY
jgi:hypothetical protein